MAFLTVLLLGLPALGSAQTVSAKLENSAQWSQAAASAGSLTDASVLASRAMEANLTVAPAAVDARDAVGAKPSIFQAAPPKTVEGRPAPAPAGKKDEQPAEEEPGAWKTLKDAFLGLFITPFMMGMALGSAGGVIGGTKAGAVGMWAGAFVGILAGLVVGAVMGAVGFVKGLFSGIGKLFRGKF